MSIAAFSAAVVGTLAATAGLVVDEGDGEEAMFELMAAIISRVIILCCCMKNLQNAFRDGSSCEVTP